MIKYIDPKILDFKEVVSAHKFPRGNNNLNYLIKTNAGTTKVLKIYNFSASMKKELKLLKFCEKSIPVPKVFNSNTGSLNYILAEYIEGQHYGDLLHSESKLKPVDIAGISYQLGKSLGKIHSLEATQLELDDPPDFFPHMFKCLFKKRNDHFFPEELSGKIWQKLIKNEEQISEQLQNRRLIHGDFKSFNIKLQKESENWRVKGILDWEFSMKASPLYDIYGFQNHVNSNFSKNSKFIFDEFLKGYKELGINIEDNWVEIAKCLNLMIPVHHSVHQKAGSREQLEAVRSLMEFAC